MGKRKEKQEKLAIYLFKHLDLFYEVPIFIGTTMTDYTVTINGDVISYKGYNCDKPKKLKPIKADNGYYKVNLNIDGKEILVSIHRLVAEAFIPNPENKPEVNHKDGKKKHNCASNLEWVTSKENIEHAVKHGLKTGMVGEKHPNHKITADTALKICELLASGEYSYSEISDIVGASYGIVKKIKNKIRWTDISAGYDFSNYGKKRR